MSPLETTCHAAGGIVHHLYTDCWRLREELRGSQPIGGDGGLPRCRVCANRSDVGPTFGSGSGSAPGEGRDVP